MNLRLLLLGFICISCFNVTLAELPSYTTTKDGVIVFTDPLNNGQLRAVKLEVVSENIIRVIASPGKDILSWQSLITVYTKKEDLSWNIVSSGGKVTLKTKALTATVDLKSGVVSFFDVNGKKILYEKPIVGRSFKPAIFDGKRCYHITQTFQTTADDAWYGLGQHQDGVYNYRGQQVIFFQNNTEVAIPFLISAKNYGILWDNYSLTTAGDTRPLHQLPSLQL
ncbi:MAG: alpha-xylosidase, partial [Ferruginibacter sp.]